MLTATPMALIIQMTGMHEPGPYAVAIFNGILGGLIFTAVRVLWNFIAKRPFGSKLSRKRLIIATTMVCLLVPLGALFFRRTSFPLVSGGKTIATARKPFVPLADMVVYAGEKKVFSLWDGMIEQPLMIHVLDAGQCFLCVFDYDTQDLVFVVDTSGSWTNTARSLSWAPFLVRDTKALVRLPSESELQMTIGWFKSLDENGFKTAAFPFRDLGFYRNYADKEVILADLTRAPR